MGENKIVLNKFIKGVNTDIAEDLIPDGFLSNGHNIKFTNDDGKQGILQKQESYIKELNGYGTNLKPLAARAFNNIIYIVSYDTVNNRVEYGTYPSAVGTPTDAQVLYDKDYVYAALPNYKTESVVIVDPPTFYSVNHISPDQLSMHVTITGGTNWELTHTVPSGLTLSATSGVDTTLLVDVDSNYTNDSIHYELIFKTNPGTITTTVPIVQKWGNWIQANPQVFNNVPAVSAPIQNSLVITNEEGFPPVTSNISTGLSIVNYDETTHLLEVAVANNPGGPRVMTLDASTSGADPETITLTFNQLEDIIESSVSSVNISAVSEAAISFTDLTASSAWTVTKPTFLSAINPPSGASASNTDIQYTSITNNNSAVPLTGNVVFTSTGSGKTATVEFTQAITGIISFTTASLDIANGAASGILLGYLTSSHVWSITSSHTMISVISPNSGGATASTAVYIDVLENTTESILSETITFRLTEFDSSGTHTATSTVNQAEYIPVISANPTSINIPGIDNTGIALTTVTATDPWQEGLASQAWILGITPSSGPAGATVVTVDVALNATGVDRVGNVNLELSSYTNHDVFLTINQAKENLTFSPTGTIALAIDADTDVTIGTLTATSPWTLQSKPSWILVNQTSGGTGGTTITIDQDANPLQDRGGNIVFILTSTSQTATVPLLQDGNAIIVTPPTSNTSSSLNVSITVNSGENWQPASLPVEVSHITYTGTELDQESAATIHFLPNETGSDIDVDVTFEFVSTSAKNDTITVTHVPTV